MFDMWLSLMNWRDTPQYLTCCFRVHLFALRLEEKLLVLTLKSLLMFFWEQLDRIWSLANLVQTCTVNNYTFSLPKTQDNTRSICLSKALQRCVQNEHSSGFKFNFTFISTAVYFFCFNRWKPCRVHSSTWQDGPLPGCHLQTGRDFHPSLSECVC